MEYKFVKLKRHDVITNWMLFCDSVEIMNQHAMKYIFAEIKKGIPDMISRLRDGCHITTTWAYALESKMMVEECGVLKASSMLEVDLAKTKSEVINDLGGIYLTDGLAYMPFNDIYKIIETYETDELIFPQYSEADIRVVKWEGGVHYYAKIGNMDVVDKDGNQKWNSRRSAMAKAKQYLNENRS